MSEPRRHLEPLRLEPRKPVATTPTAGAKVPAGPPAGYGAPVPSSGPTRAFPAIAPVVVAVVLLVVGAAGLGAFLLLRRDTSDSSVGMPTTSPPLAPAAVINDGTDANRPVLPDADRGFVDTRGGWGWGDKCWVSLKASKWGWAKAECDKGMAMNPASPQPRASLLYNEGLVAKAAGKIDEARQDFRASLALRENAEVRAALAGQSSP
jgi:hypothetical protein